MTTTTQTGLFTQCTGTAAAWATTTKVVPAGVLMVETDTGLTKYGDGVNLYATLPYSANVCSTLGLGNGVMKSTVGNLLQLKLSDSSLTLDASGVKVTASAFGTRTTEVTGFAAGAPTASQLLSYRSLLKATSFAANFAGSVARCKVAPTNQVTITVNSYTSSGTTPTAIGAITFAAGSVVGTFATTGGTGQNLTTGQVIEMVYQGSTDSTFSGVGITLLGTY